MTDSSIDNSINLIYTNLNYAQNNIHLANVNIMEMLSSLTTIRNSITDINYIDNLLNTLGQKILLQYLIDGSNNVARIVRNCPNLTVNTDDPINNDKLYLNLKDSLDTETLFKLNDLENNTTNYIIFLLDPSQSVITFQSINLTENSLTDISLQNLNTFDLDTILAKNVNYFEIKSTNTHYKLVLVNQKLITN